MNAKSDDQYSDEETARRRDAAISRALRTPPSPNKKIADSEKTLTSRKRDQKGAEKYIEK